MRLTVLIMLLLYIPFRMCAQNGSVENLALERMISPSPADKKKIIMEAERLNRDGAIFRYIHPDSAVIILQHSFRLSHSVQYWYGMADALLVLGSTYSVNKGEPLSGLPYIKQAYNFSQKVQDSLLRYKLLFRWYNCMGAIYCELGKLDSGTQSFYNAIRLAEDYDLQEDRFLMMTYNNLGYLYHLLRQYNNALYYFRKAEQLSGSAQLYKSELGRTYVMMASVMLRLGKQKEAKLMINKTQTLDIPISSRLKIMIISNKAEIAKAEGKLQQSAAYFNEVLEAPNHDRYLELNCLLGLGSVYYMMGNFGKAEVYYNRANHLSLQLGIAMHRLNAYKGLAATYDQLGRHAEAYANEKKASALKDSMESAELMLRIGEMEMLYRLTEKDKEIARKQVALLKAQNKASQSKAWLFITLSSVLALTLTLILIFQRHRRLVQKARNQEKEAEVKQLKAILEGEEKERNRIGHQLHDDIMIDFALVKMSLDMLVEEFPDIEPSDRYETVLKRFQYATTKLRHTAHNIMLDRLLEDGIIPALHYFCKSIERMAGLSVDFQVYGDFPEQESVSPDFEINIYRIIQELIHNVIKHAKATHVLVLFYYRQGNITLTVEDNGTGFTADEETGRGMGITSIRNRLKTMSGEIEFYKRKPHGTSVNIEITL